MRYLLVSADNHQDKKKIELPNEMVKTTKKRTIKTKRLSGKSLTKSIKRKKNQTSAPLIKHGHYRYQWHSKS